MSISITLSQHWLSYFYLNKPKQLSISAHGLTHEGTLIPWQSVVSFPIKDDGFFFSAISWKTSEQYHQCFWLPKNLVTQAYFDLGKYWCSHQQHKLIQFSQAARNILNTAYVRKSAFNKLVLAVQNYLNNWPRSVELDWLSEDGYRSFHYLLKVSQLTLSDLTTIQQKYIHRQKAQYAYFFNSIERHPLTDLQQSACIINEKNNLVLAGAGTGKTSTMVGRAGYLMASKQALPSQILLLAFGKQAAKEMNQRIEQCLNLNTISASTFHSLGLKIIKSVTGKTPKISELAISDFAKEQWIEHTFNEFLTCTSMQQHTVNYLADHLYAIKNAFEFSSKGDYLRYLTEQNVVSFNGEAMRCFGELAIANFLTRLGIRYQYQVTYKDKTNNKLSTVYNIKHRPYRACFYLPDDNIYIEHWQCTQQGLLPSFLKSNEYQAEIEHIRNIHAKYNSHLIETFTVKADLSLNEPLYKGMLNTLAVKLKSLGVVCKEEKPQQLLHQLGSNHTMATFYKQLAEMLSLIKSARTVNKANNSQATNKTFSRHVDHFQQKAAFALLTPLFKAYQQTLHKRDEIDFDDMINMAISHIESRRYISPFKHILIDEFQDISAPRAMLVKALRDQVDNSSVFCVGDDWQAIYRFSGSDVSLTTQFQSSFGDSAISILDKTFRFNNSISEIAEKFVCKNPAQIRKTLKTQVQVNEPAVKVITTTESSILQKIISIIDSFAEQNTQYELGNKTQKVKSVFILSRYAFNLPNEKQISQIAKRCTSISVKALTIHASKGMEADIVIITSMHNGKNGFPSMKQTTPFIDGLLPQENHFLHAEERRLLYVALTRAKKQVFLLADAQQPSEFVKELINENYPLTLIDEECTFSQDKTKHSFCVECETGIMLPKKYKSSLFFGCSNYPRCSFSQ